MKRLVIVANRVPIPGDRNAVAGGLAVALADAVTPGSMWFGWSGSRVEATTTVPVIHTARGVTFATIDLGETDYQRYYSGFSNNTLYPLLLFRLGLVEFRQEDYAGYREVNRTFARALAPLLQPDDMIWVHDYQMMAVAHELRALGVQQRIGFFLHTPFVPPALFTVLPRARDLMDALCACDVIGFHTDDHRSAFLECAKLLLGVDPDANGVFRHKDRQVEVIVNPVGIDVAGFSAAAVRAASGTPVGDLVRSLGGRPLVVSVDRLDYAKGLPNRITAIKHLLEDHPEHRRNVTFLQVAAPSREELDHYRALRHELDRAVGDINGRFSEPDWTPIRYITRALGRNTLAGIYRHARLGVVTPMRDGMNLVAKEYVAAQNPDDPGVLVLSRFAGAAEQMTDALIVNPYDAEEISGAIHRGLNMPLAERQDRHKALLAVVRASSARHFCERFLSSLDRPVIGRDVTATRPPMQQERT